MASHPETIAWEGDLPGHVRLLDQTRLPAEEVVMAVRTVDEMVDAIRRLAVRGAPAIGVAAGYGVLLGVQEQTATDPDDLVARVRETAATLARARPTAVNLFFALDRMVACAERGRREGLTTPALLERLLAEARLMHREDAETCRRMGELGAALLDDGMTVLTHCNAGALATAGMGTALAPIYVAAEAGKRLRVIADETRPLLQGRLTAWELRKAGIDVTLIADGAAGSQMQAGRVGCVIVGADRIARNGDVCNKIGTYGVAVLARHHGIPFYVVAPLSTFDLEAASGADVPIEERAASELTGGLGERSAPDGVDARNPAFDVTPAELVSAIVTEAGIIERPDANSVTRALRRGGRL